MLELITERLVSGLRVPTNAYDYEQQEDHNIELHDSQYEECVVTAFI